jgi:hypothetical protein
MLSHFIWSSSIVLAFLVIIRGLQTKLASHYPIFYAYVAYVLLFEDIASYLIRHWNPGLYLYVYWITEFVGVVIGCGVVFEIFRMGLLRYPGTAKMARNALAVIFALALAKALVTAADKPGWWLQANTLEIERVLRTVQAVAVAALAGVCLLYAIPFRKNLRGILLGYGLFVGVLAVCLTFVPTQGHNFWWYAYSACYPVALAVWLIHLWSYTDTENCVPAPTDNFAAGDGGSGNAYQQTATATRRRLQTARGDLVKAVRP